MRTRIAAAVLIAPVLFGAASRLLHAQPQPQRQIHTPNAIVGKVTNAAGQPVPGVGVTLVVRDELRGQIRFHPAMANLLVKTDEKGEYRIDNAQPGEYFVAAIPQNARLDSNGRPNRTGYGVTYYPSAKAAAEGMPVVVNVRGPVTADITLKDVPLAVVAGTVVDHTGGPARGQVLHIAHGDNLFGVDSRAVQPRDDGAFALPGMPPGTYFLQMREGPWPPPRDLETPLISGARVVVDGKDVTNVRVVPIRMVRATGRIIVDPAVRAMLQPSTISVAANPVSFDGNPGPQRAGTVTKDLTFEFRTWPGRGWVRVGLESGQWKVKSIRYKGTDLTSEGAIDFVEGQDISDIEIELIRAGG